MKQTVIHYNTALDPLRNSIPACRVAALGFRTTPFPELVTCKTCIKMLGRTS